MHPIAVDQGHTPLITIADLRGTWLLQDTYLHIAGLITYQYEGYYIIIQTLVGRRLNIYKFKLIEGNK
jgi:hypothetical protein